MLRACFDDCRTIGSLKLVHQSSTTLFRPRFEMSLVQPTGLMNICPLYWEIRTCWIYFNQNFDSESLIQLGLIIVNVPMVKMINCALNHPPLWTKMLWLPTLPPSFHQKQRLKVPGPCTDSNSGFHTSRIFSWLCLASCSVLICARGDCFRREGGEFTCAFESGLLITFWFVGFL